MNTSYGNLRSFRSTRWTQRVSSLKLINSNYHVLLTFLYTLATSKNEDADMKAEATGFLKRLLKFDTMFLLEGIISIFEKIEILNTALQSANLYFSAINVKCKVIKTSLQSNRQNRFPILRKNALEKCEKLGIQKSEATVGSKSKFSSIFNDDFEFGGSEACSMSKEEECQRIYFEIIHLESRFNTETLQNLKVIVKFLVTGTGELNAAVENAFEMYTETDLQRLLLDVKIFLDAAQKDDPTQSSMFERCCYIF